MNGNEQMIFLESQLNSFDLSKRTSALMELAELLKSGKLSVSSHKNEVNLHFHTFFSFNSNYWSPSRIAWESKKYGLAMSGIVDFDVLDGMREFLNAGQIMDLRVASALETRVFVKEYSDKVITSPNEPGITYFMAAGCFKEPTTESRGVETLRGMREMAKKRNITLMEKVNSYLDEVQLDYDRDAVSLTPSGNVTERHMLSAYDNKARAVFCSDNLKLSDFWANKLNIPLEISKELIDNIPALHEKMRSALMKYGGVGYVAPTSDSFPAIETVVEMINDMGALPTATWLDGTSPGEADLNSMLELFAVKGVVAMNIIPDRNWNIKDIQEKTIKLDNLAKAVKTAKDFDMPLCVGTEMNKIGLPFVDNFSTPELQSYVNDFMDGAYFFWGLTFLALKSDMGYASKWAKSEFGNNRAKKNEFYTKIGKLVNPVDLSNDKCIIDVNTSAYSDVLKTFGG